ncbi:MAG: B12-binding domain-containing radical SAM protein [Planctomycetaceae bacterium]
MAWPNCVPDDNVHCLLIQPEFRASNFWNLTESAATTGARTVAPPLGLLTVAAILPQHWTFQLVDLNVRPLSDDEWEAADVICTGGMIPQQSGILSLIDRANRDGKYIVVGGPDPTSQPDIYCGADARVLGEGEASIPVWMESWRAGNPCGLFAANGKPDVTLSPTPRFDLVDFRYYLQVGIQISRGCPFNCEFCDIIELYGRVPRSKTVPQVLAELDRIADLGYRGWIDISDDNFIGNKRFVKSFLSELERWCQRRKFPFYFSTEASMNLADDDELLDLMKRCDFRFVFMGIETPDPDLLAVTQKKINSMKPIVERVHHVYKHGISISAGFILGFDSEKPGIADAMIECIEETGIMVSMVGLLVALPNTQLTRRLMREGRMIGSDHQLIPPSSETLYRLENPASSDNTTGGLNFVSTRDRREIYDDYRRIIAAVYDPNVYMKRVMRTTRMMRPERRQQPSLRELIVLAKALARIAWWMTRNRQVRRHYWINTLRALPMGMAKFEFCQSHMAAFMHLGAQADRVATEMQVGIDFANDVATYPLSTDDLPSAVKPLLPVAAGTCASS